MLFLDELPEFKRHVLETLREPIEEGRIAISRARSTVVFPARFQLIAAMNPCPCGNRGSTRQTCNCTPMQVERYLGKISGPLLDRISIHMPVRPVEMEAYRRKQAPPSSRSIRAVVLEARAVQSKRLASHGPVVLNARLSVKLTRRFCQLGDEAETLLLRAQKRLRISARGRGHVLRVARTIADLEGSDMITFDHVAEAIQYQTRERAR